MEMVAISPSSGGPSDPCAGAEWGAGPPTPGTPSGTHREDCLGVARVAGLAAKDGEEGVRDDILGWFLFLTENLGRTLGIAPGKLFSTWPKKPSGRAGSGSKRARSGGPSQASV